MPKRNYTDHKSNQGLNYLLAFYNFITKKPMHALIYFLLASKILARAEVIRVKETEDGLISVTYSEDLDYLIDKAIETNEYDEIEIDLDKAIRKSPDDVFLLEQKLYLSVYRDVIANHHLFGLSKFQNIINKLLILDPTNELALAIKILQKDSVQELDYLNLPENGKLKFPLSYFARGVVNRGIGVKLQNIALFASAISDFNSAIKLEKHEELKKLYIGTLNDVETGYSRFHYHPTYQDIDFGNLHFEYTFNVNVKSANSFNHEEGRFRSEEINQAIAEHYPLILGNIVGLTPEGQQLITSADNPFVLIAKDEHFHLYQASLSAEYVMQVREGYQNREYKFYKTEFSPNFLEQSVTGIIAPNGAIITSSKDLSSSLEHHRSVKRNKLKKGLDDTPDRFGSKILQLFAFALVLIPITVFISRTYKTLQDKWKERGLRILAEARYARIRDLLLSTMKESYLPLTTDEVWQYIGNDLLIYKKDLVANQINLRKHPVLLKKYPELPWATFSKKDFNDLWLRKFGKFFGEKNIISDKDILQIKIDYPIIPNESCLSKNITSLMEELLIDLVLKSPEYNIQKLIASCATSGYEWQNVHTRFQQFWVENKTIIKQCQLVADFYQDPHPLAAKAAKLNEVCQEFYVYFPADDEYGNKTEDLIALTALENKSLNEIHDDLLTKLAGVKSENLAEVNNAVQKYTIRINDLPIKLHYFKEKLVMLNNKLEKLFTLKESLEVSARKLQSCNNNSNSNNNNSIFKNTKTTKKETKKVNQESPEEREARLAKFRQSVAMAKEEKQKSLEMQKRKEEELKKQKEKIKEIKKLKNDPLVSTLHHHLNMISEALALHDNPKEQDMIKFFSGKQLYAELSNQKYKDLVYYILWLAMLKGSHSLGQMMGRYGQYYIVEIKPYIVRNFLMHQSWLIGMKDMQLLTQGALEFVKEFQQLIANLHLSGFPDQVQKISMQSTLFSDEFLNEKKLAMKIDLPTLITEIDHHFQMICFIDQLVQKMSEKTKDNFLNCGLLHQAIRACLALIGVLLDDLKPLDRALYNQIKKAIFGFKNLCVQTESGNSLTLYQDVRRRVAHFFAEGDSSKIKITFIAKDKNTYVELSEKILAIVCHESAELYRSSLGPIFAQFQPGINLESDTKSLKN